MLIKFKFKNFISYKDETIVNFEKKSKEELGSDLIINKNGHSLLNTHCFIGVNGSGKSAFQEALAHMKILVMTSHNHNINQSINAIHFSGSNKPIDFEVTFLSEGKKYIYGFSYNKERIIREFAKVYETQKAQTLFSRKFDEKLKDYSYTPLRSSLKNIKKQVIPQTLLLSRAVQLNNEVLKPIYNFFIRAYFLGRNEGIDFSIFKDSALRNKLLDILSYADFAIKDFRLIENRIVNTIVDKNGETQNTPIKRMELFFEHESDKNFEIHYNAESLGTQRFISLFSQLLKIREGGMILIDEIASSFNLEIVKFIIDYVTKEMKETQLIFSTHQSEILNWLRSDQIYIIEKENSVSSITNLHQKISGNDKINKCYGDYYREGVLGGQPQVYNPYA